MESGRDLSIAGMYIQSYLHILRTHIVHNHGDDIEEVYLFQMSRLSRGIARTDHRKERTLRVLLILVGLIIDT